MPQDGMWWMQASMNHATFKLLIFAQALQWECFSDVVTSKVSSWVHGCSKSSGAAGVLLHLDPRLCISSLKSNPCCPVPSCPPASGFGLQPLLSLCNAEYPEAIFYDCVGLWC